MNKDGTLSHDGEYYYNYNLSSSATYGKYDVKVTATTSDGAIVIDKTSFMILPWNASEETRSITGIGQAKDISDKDLEHIIWLSYMEALRDVYEHHYGESPKGNPDTGAGFDGTNTTFQTRHIPIADIDGDNNQDLIFAL